MLAQVQFGGRGRRAPHHHRPSRRTSKAKKRHTLSLTHTHIHTHTTRATHFSKRVFDMGLPGRGVVGNSPSGNSTGYVADRNGKRREKNRGAPRRSNLRSRLRWHGWRAGWSNPSNLVKQPIYGHDGLSRTGTVITSPQEPTLLEVSNLWCESTTSNRGGRGEGSKGPGPRLSDKAARTHT
ncbi:hypothetical protein LX36DRAFT_434112 [Colletotrichum falcatum]|nr:hypothetical protein LX36DRAFT_434112 [Colletotrichum falcatum]